MRKLFNFFVLILFLLLTFQGNASALEIHVTSDPGGTATTGIFTPGVIFDIYVTAESLVAPDPLLLGFEFNIDLSNFYSIPGFNVGAFLPPGSLNVGTGDNFIVGLSAPMPTGPAPVLLATFQLLPLVSVDDVLISLGPATPSSFNPLAPGYIDDSFLLSPFTFASSLLLNPMQLDAPPLHNPVPIPAAIYLLGAGFVGLAGLRRKLKK